MAYVQSDHRAIELRLEDNWGEETEIAFKNVEFESDDYDEWIRLTIIDGDSKQMSLEETPLHRRVGLIIIQVFVRPDTGTKRIEELAGRAADIFRAVQFDGITCRSPMYREIGDAKNWFQANVETEFYVDEQF